MPHGSYASDPIDPCEERRKGVVLTGGADAMGSSCSLQPGDLLLMLDGQQQCLHGPDLEVVVGAQLAHRHEAQERVQVPCNIATVQHVEHNA